MSKFGAGSINEKSLPGLVLSTIPTVTCILLFLSAYSTLKNVYVTESTGTLHPLPYVAMVVQCLIWFSYGVIAWSFPVMIPNFIGLVCGIVYTYIFQLFAADLQTLHNLYIAGLMIIVFFFYLVIDSKDLDERERKVGLLAMILAIFFNFSPLVSLARVIQTKSVTAMPFQMSFLVFWNSFFWTIYGWFVRDDFTIWSPNFLAWISGCLQMLCHFIYGDVLQSMRDMFSDIFKSKKRKESDMVNGLSSNKSRNKRSSADTESALVKDILGEDDLEQSILDEIEPRNFRTLQAIYAKTIHLNMPRRYWI